MLILLSLLPGLMTFDVSLQANPRGPNVRAGNVNFQGLGTANLDINNMSNRAIINWQSFSIDSGEVTRVNQGRNAFTLNRVVTGNPTAIYGQLRAAKGGVAVINPNGIVVHEGGVVDVGGMLTMSTLDISDNDFLNGGSNRFRGNTGAGIENYGAISSASGDVVLLGNFLRNAGSVSAPGGTVAFGAGGDIIVDHTASGGKISVLAGGPGGGTGIDNSGVIEGAAAELKAHGNVYALAIQNTGVVRASGYNFTGGKLTLNAGSRGSIVNTGQLSARNSDGSGGRVSVSGGSVSIGGSVDASGAAGMNGGVVDVRGRDVNISETANVSVVGSDAGSVSITGTETVDLGGAVDASSTIGNGGDVSVTAASVNVGATANVDVSGMAAGGTVRIGGGVQGNDGTISNAQNTTVEEGATIIADSEEGNAGSVVVWADNDTIYRGVISAQAFGNVGNGGFVEVSGLDELLYFGTVSTMSANGNTGTLLLDPTNVVIGPNGGTGVTITDTALVDAVRQNNVVIHTASLGADPGNITVQGGSNVVYDSPNSLAFFAHGDIFVNGDIKNHGTTDYIGGINVPMVEDPQGTGNITLFAGWDGTGANLFSFDPQNPGSNTGTGPIVNAAAILAGTYGEWGQNQGSVFLNPGAQEAVEVGSARGETNAFGFDIDIRGGDGGGEFGQLGYRRESDIRGGVLLDPNTPGVFTGQVAGMTSAVTITADSNSTSALQLVGNGATTLGSVFRGDLNDGVGDPIGEIVVRNISGSSVSSTVVGDGVMTVDQLIADFNANNTEQIELVSGNGSAVIANGESFTLDGLIAQFNAANDGPDLSLGAGDDANQVVDYAPLTFSNTLNTAFGIDMEDGVVGNINAYAQQDILMVPNPITTNEEGVKARDRTYTKIGHGGLRDNSDDFDDLPGTDFGSDSGHISVGDGDNNGDITVVAGRAIIMSGDRAEAYTQIGHGSGGFDNPNGHGGNNTDNGTVAEHFAFSGNSVNGDTSGDISVTTGVFDMQAGFYNRSYAMVGHGGMRSRGVHEGNIDLTTTEGGIRVQAAPDSAIGGPANSNDWRWRNNRDQSFAQVGHGGFDADYSNGTIMPARTVILNTNDGPGDSVANSSVAGDGIQINPETGRAYGHGGDITVTSAGGIEFRAGNGTDAYAMLGHGGRSTSGDHFGDITVEAQNGDIIFDRDADQVNERGRDITNRGQRAHVQIGHGGTRYVGGSTGDIEVRATGDIEFYGGRNESYAMVGHGGRGEDSTTWNGGRQRGPLTANGTHSGDITVIAGGDITFRSGFSLGGQAYSQIGHGGFYQQADVLDGSADAVANGGLIGGGAPDESQTGHNGDIIVDAGGSISFKAGADSLREGQTFFESNNYDSWTMIGHGGYFSKGDHHGSVDVTARTGSFEMEGRGGWDAISIIGGNGDDAPRLNNAEDNSRNGFRNWAQIGHGGYDAAHENNNATQNYNNSGANGIGFGVRSASPINVDVAGSFSMLGAMEATAGPMIPIGIIADNGSDASVNIGEVQNTYLRQDGVTPVTPGQMFSEHWGRLETVTRANGEIWTLNDIVLSAEDSYAQIGHGGRSSGYLGGVDGEGHRGDITVTVGGSLDMIAGDIQREVATGQVLNIQVENYQGVDGAGNTDPLVGMGTVGGSGVYYVGPGIGNDTSTFFPNANGNLDRSQQNDPTVGDGNYAQIGLGGRFARGDHLSNISVTAGGDLNVIAGEGRESYAQIGNGGHDADGSNDNNNRGGDEGNSGEITIQIQGALALLAGGRDNDVSGLTGTDPASLTGLDDSRAVYAQIGHGGTFNGGNHHDDITVSAGTGVEVIAGSERHAYAQIGHGAYAGRSESLVGDIVVVTDSGDIILQGGSAIVDSETSPGGLDNDGNISIAREAWSRIGHGGFDNDAQSGNQDNGPGSGGFTGDITVATATGNVSVVGGGRSDVVANNDNYRSQEAQIGHGGYATDGDFTGNVSVGAGGTILVQGGSSAREAFGQIGHGGYATDGNHSGTIDLDAGGNVVLVRGDGQFNPWSKIGHGAQAFGGRNDNGSGNRNGDIFISAGNDFNSTGGLVGHVDPFNDGTLFAYDEGDTYIAVSRNNPFAGGPGQFITDSTTVLASAGFGVGSELRLYMPDSGANLIAEGTYINNGEYTRTPAPGSGRTDEEIATEHQFVDGEFGEPEGEFTPEGDYPINDNAFGLYFIYYAGENPDPPVTPIDPGITDPIDPDPVDPGPVDPVFDFGGFFLPGQLGDFEEDEGILAMGLAGENNGLFDAIGMDEADDDSNLGRKRRKRLTGGVGPIGLTYYTFNPDTNKYSSYRVFGVEQSNLTVAQ